MKRLASLLLVLVMCLSLCACGSRVSEEVRALQEKIDKALEGETAYASLLEIQELYGNLSAEEQEQVENYDKLEALLKLNSIEVAGIFSINQLKGMLFDPSSFELLSISGAANDSKAAIKIDYKASAVTGETVEGTYYFLVDAPTYDETSGEWSCGLDEEFVNRYNAEVTNLFAGVDTAESDTSQYYAEAEYKGGEPVTLDTAKLMDNADLYIVEIE